MCGCVCLWVSGAGGRGAEHTHTRNKHGCRFPATLYSHVYMRTHTNTHMLAYAHAHAHAAHLLAGLLRTSSVRAPTASTATAAAPGSRVSDRPPPCAAHAYTLPLRRCSPPRPAPAAPVPRAPAPLPLPTALPHGGAAALGPASGADAGVPGALWLVNDAASGGAVGGCVPAAVSSTTGVRPRGGSAPASPASTGCCSERARAGPGRQLRWGESRVYAVHVDTGTACRVHPPFPSHPPARPTRASLHAQARTLRHAPSGLPPVAPPAAQSRGRRGRPPARWTAGGCAAGPKAP